VTTGEHINRLVNEEIEEKIKVWISKVILERDSESINNRCLTFD
jgi:hypothetical protein